MLEGASSPSLDEGRLLSDPDLPSPHSSASHLPAAMMSAEVASSAKLTSPGTATTSWEGLPALGSQAVMNGTSQGFLSAQSHLVLPSDARHHGVLPSVVECQASPEASLGYTAPPGSNSLTARLAGLLKGIAKDKKVKEERGRRRGERRRGGRRRGKGERLGQGAGLSAA